MDLNFQAIISNQPKTVLVIRGLWPPTLSSKAQTADRTPGIKKYHFMEVVLAQHPKVQGPLGQWLEKMKRKGECDLSWVIGHDIPMCSSKFLCPGLEKHRLRGEANGPASWTSVWDKQPFSSSVFIKNT